MQGEAEFQPGETVRLRAGGPVMVVVEATAGERYRCAWFDDRRGELVEEFAAERLETAPEPE